ncbi:MAG: hypothetical protein GKS06_01035 [Acidobacteria bacterium]|nr:hypothetical protein [Acidobacteriota bacterium]
MLSSPAFIVAASLVVAFAIGLVIGLLRGRRESAAARSEGARRRLAEADLEDARNAVAEHRERIRELELAADTAASEGGAATTHLESELAATREALGNAKRDALAANREFQQAAANHQQRAQVQADQFRQVQAELESTVNELEVLRATPTPEPTEPDTAFRNLEEKLARREARIERLQADLRELERGYATQIEERDVELTTLRSTASERGGEAASLKRSLQQAQDALETRRGELRTAQSSMSESRAARTHLEAEIVTLRDNLQSAHSALEQARAEATELERGYSAQIEQRAAHVDELLAARERAEERANEAHRQLQDRSNKLENALAGRAEVEAQTRNREDRAEALQRELREALDHAEAERVATNTVLAEVQAGAERSFADLDSTRAELSTTSDELERSRGEMQRLQDNFDALAEDSERKLKERSLEVDHLSRTVATRSSDIERLQGQLQDEATRVEAAKTGVVAAVEQKMATQETLSARERDLRDAQDELRRQSTALDSVRTDLEESEARAERRLRERALEAERLSNQLRGREQEITRAAELASSLEARIKQEEERVETRDQRIVVLEDDQRRAAEARDRMLRDLHDREQETRRLRSLVHAQPSEQDRLEEIDGIGPSIASLLNAVGVRSFREIAGWDQRTMDWLTVREPQLKGRLRADWIEAARDAYEAKYGASPTPDAPRQDD